MKKNRYPILDMEGTTLSGKNRCEKEFDLLVVDAWLNLLYELDIGRLVLNQSEWNTYKKKEVIIKMPLLNLTV